MPLLIIVTLHLHICGMHELLYVHNTTVLSVDVGRSAIFGIQKKHLQYF